LLSSKVQVLQKNKQLQATAEQLLRLKNPQK